MVEQTMKFIWRVHGRCGIVQLTNPLWIHKIQSGSTWVVELIRAAMVQEIMLDSYKIGLLIVRFQPRSLACLREASAKLLPVMELRFGFRASKHPTVEQAFKFVLLFLLLLEDVHR